MKLYMSSYQLGDNPEKLAELFGENKKVAVIPNALDFSDDLPRVERNLAGQRQNLEALGLEPEVLDLKDYFGKEDELLRKIETLGGVWVIGGNSFVLRVAFAKSGFDNIVKNLVSSPTFVYSGFSAGICVLQASMKGIQFVDDPELVRTTYNSEPVWEGVGLLNFVFVPHFESDHEESEDTNKEVKYYEEHGIKYKTVRDGEVLTTEITHFPIEMSELKQHSS